MSNKQLRKHLEEKYNINLDTQTEEGGKTYFDLKEYFTKEIEEDNIIISTDVATMCCSRTDITSITEEFNIKLNELTKYESNDVCQDPYAEPLESAIGHSCPYSANINNDRIQQDQVPAYN